MLERSTSCVDWAEKLRRGESIIPPPIFPEQAAQALAIFKELKIADAPGSPSFGEACGQWVFDLVASIFGAYDAETGRRLITEWFVLIPKKNAKSTIAAGIMMTALIMNWRQSAEFVILAPTIEVAGNSFIPCRDMVKHDDELDDIFNVQTHIKTITHRNSDATLKVVAADTNTVVGKKGSATLVDELWLFGKRANADDMLREATGGLASRPEGFVIYLTTQSDTPPTGVFRRKLQYARDVRDGKINDPGFVPVIFELPPDDAKRIAADPESITIDDIALVNPNLGYSVDRAFIERELTKELVSGRESLRGFLSKHANVEVGLALRDDRWAGAEFWEESALPEKLTLDELIDRCEVITAGIDGGGLDDLLGAAVLGREKETNRWLLWTHAWAHPIVLNRRKDIASELIDLSNDGDLTIIGDQIGRDLDDLALIFKKLYDSGLLDKIGVDQAGIGAVIDTIVNAGVPQDIFVGISQGWKLSGAIKTAERKVAERNLVHGGQRLMSWCVSNARVVPVGNAVTITKQASGSAKIDALMAMFDAVWLMALNPPPKNSYSVYSSGVLI